MVSTEVVLIDDHPLFTRGLELLLSATGAGVRVVGRTDDAAMAVGLVLRCRPDAAIIDLAMPPPGGHEAIRAIKRAVPETRVLALSGLADPEEATRALRCGAEGFLPKTSEPEELVRPLLAMLGGCSVLPRDLLQLLLQESQRSGTDAVDELDDDERSLWRLVARGASTEDIARDLLVSERTAKRMIAALLRRIGAENRIHAAALAGRSGLLDEPAG